MTGRDKSNCAKQAGQFGSAYCHNSSNKSVSGVGGVGSHTVQSTAESFTALRDARSWVKANQPSPEAPPQAAFLPTAGR